MEQTHTTAQSGNFPTSNSGETQMTRQMTTNLVMAALAIVFVAHSAQAQLTVGATRDTRIQENSPTTNYGMDPTSGIVVIDQTGGSLDHRGLVAFDNLPAITSAEVGSALLRLTVDQGNGTVDTRPLTTPWTEGDGGDGGAGATTGVTWNTTDGTNAWPSGAGALGDAGGVTDSQSLSGAGTVDWDVTSAVKGWLDGTPNHGLLLIESVRAGSSAVFKTREESAQLGPQLVITVIPEPSALILMTAASGLCLVRRRR